MGCNRYLQMPHMCFTDLQLIFTAVETCMSAAGLQYVMDYLDQSCLLATIGFPVHERYREVVSSLVTRPAMRTEDRRIANPEG